MCYRRSGPLYVLLEPRKLPYTLYCTTHDGFRFLTTPYNWPVSLGTSHMVYVPQRLEEEPYTCGRSCGCPSSYNLWSTKAKDVLYWIKTNRVEWLAGITTGLTAVPTAVAFAILAGVQPSVGLRGTWIIMLVMSLFGGKVLATVVPGGVYFFCLRCASGKIGG